VYLLFIYLITGDNLAGQHFLGTLRSCIGWVRVDREAVW